MRQPTSSSSGATCYRESGASGLAGYRGAHLMRRDLDGAVEFLTILWFDSLAAVKAFAGEDHEAAYVPEPARRLLARFDARSRHYEVVLAPEP